MSLSSHAVSAFWILKWLRLLYLSNHLKNTTIAYSSERDFHFLFGKISLLFHVLWYSWSVYKETLFHWQENEEKNTIQIKKIEKKKKKEKERKKRLQRKLWVLRRRKIKLVIYLYLWIKVPTVSHFVLANPHGCLIKLLVWFVVTLNTVINSKYSDVNLPQKQKFWSTLECLADRPWFVKHSKLSPLIPRTPIVFVVITNKLNMVPINVCCLKWCQILVTTCIKLNTHGF